MCFQGNTRGGMPIDLVYVGFHRRLLWWVGWSHCRGNKEWKDDTFPSPRSTLRTETDYYFSVTSILHIFKVYSKIVINRSLRLRCWLSRLRLQANGYLPDRHRLLLLLRLFHECLALGHRRFQTRWWRLTFYRQGHLTLTGQYDIETG